MSCSSTSFPTRPWNSRSPSHIFAGTGFALYDGLRSGDEERVDPGAAVLRRRRSAITTFVLIFLAEWGDLIQVLTINLAAR